jgi:hypothetical protein
MKMIDFIEERRHPQDHEQNAAYENRGIQRKNTASESLVGFNDFYIMARVFFGHSLIICHFVFFFQSVR